MHIFIYVKLCENLAWSYVPRRIELYTVIEDNQLNYIMDKLTSLCYNVIIDHYHMITLLS
jgi:hypothetical protein